MRRSGAALAFGALAVILVAAIMAAELEAPYWTAIAGALIAVYAATLSTVQAIRSSVLKNAPPASLRRRWTHPRLIGQRPSRASSQSAEDGG
jgi:hypothetical protein